MSSGLGGGSADAAAALRILARLWRLDVDDARLSEIGLFVGADVPVCIAGIPCRMTGIGETVTPVNPFPPCAVVLVNGGEAVATLPYSLREKTFFQTVPLGRSRSVSIPLSLRSETVPTTSSAAACTVSPMIADVLAERPDPMDVRWLACRAAAVRASVCSPTPRRPRLRRLPSARGTLTGGARRLVSANIG